jgi:glycosyltransferase involved in cell wall biosynthesis
VAIAHDYLTQRGGAERVVLALAKAFPGAPIHTTVYEPNGTFPELCDLEIHTTPLQRIGPLRRNPRPALPLLAPAVSRHTIDADVTICSTSGWAHGFACTGRKVAFVHNTARWLYQRDEYLANLPRSYGAALAPFAPALRRWDRRAAATIDTAVANSAVTKQRVAERWGRDAAVLHPPPGLSPEGRQDPVPGIEPGFYLTVARLLPYKRLDVVLDAVAGLPGARLVVVGDGPDRARLGSRATRDVSFHPTVSDPELRWLYAHATALVTAAQEDFGLTALEAMAFGVPVAAPDEGGFRETVEHGTTGLLYEEATASCLRAALVELSVSAPDPAALRARAADFSEQAFIRRVQAWVDESAGNCLPSSAASAGSAYS